MLKNNKQFFLFIFILFFLFYKNHLLLLLLMMQVLHLFLDPMKRDGERAVLRMRIDQMHLIYRMIQMIYLQLKHHLSMNNAISSGA